MGLGKHYSDVSEAHRKRKGRDVSDAHRKERDVSDAHRKRKGRDLGSLTKERKVHCSNLD